MATLKIDGDELVLLRIELDGTAFNEWIVGCTDPEAVAARLGLPQQP